MADTKKSCDIPITKEMLDETRSELKSDITSVRLEMKSGFNKVDAKFKEMDARFKEVDASINGLKSEMEEADERFAYMEQIIRSRKREL